MEAKEINKEIAKIIYGKDIVIDDEHGLIASSKERLLESLRIGRGGIETTNDKTSPKPTFCLEIPDYCGNIKSAIFLLNLIAKKCDVSIFNNYGSISGMLGWSVNIKKNNEYKTFKDENIGKAICLAFIEFSKDTN